MLKLKDTNFNYHVGIIEDMDFKTKTITYRDSFGLHRLPVNAIVSIDILE